MICNEQVGCESEAKKPKIDVEVEQIREKVPLNVNVTVNIQK